MNHKIILPLIASFALAAAARAEDALSAAAKKLFAEKQDSVLWVSAVAKTSFTTDGGGEMPMNLPDQENKMESLGTIIDASGLVVSVLSQLEPARSVSGRIFRGTKVEAVSTLKDVKVTMADGTEIPAEIVMKDADLDLAFVRIKTDSKEAKGIVFKAVDLKDSATGNIMDETVTVARMDDVLNRVASVYTGPINMITRKPRLFLRANGGMNGCPTFLTNGKLLGITTTRMVKNKAPVGVILPAADIAEIAEQAKTAKPEAEAKPKESETEKKQTP